MRVLRQTWLITQTTHGILVLLNLCTPTPLVKKSWTFLSKKQELWLTNLFGNTSLQVSTKLKKLITSSQNKLHSLVQTYGNWYGKLKFLWKSVTLYGGFSIIVFPLFSPWKTGVFVFKAPMPWGRWIPISLVSVFPLL